MEDAKTPRCGNSRGMTEQRPRKFDMTNDSKTTDPRVEAAAAAMWEQRPMMRTEDGAPRPWDEVPARSYGARYRGQAQVALAAADAVDHRTPRMIETDAASRERLVNLLLAHRGTPRERLFEYPYRTDESWELIQQAETAVADVLKILNSTPEAEAAA